MAGAPGDAPETLRDFIGTIRADTPFRAVHEILPDADDAGLLAEDAGRKPLSCAALRRFAAALDLRAFGLARADTLCAAIPNGPEAATMFLEPPQRASF